VLGTHPYCYLCSGADLCGTVPEAKSGRGIPCSSLNCYGISGDNGAGGRERSPAMPIFPEFPSATACVNKSKWGDCNEE
jgi:hypothetical protein